MLPISSAGKIARPSAGDSVVKNAMRGQSSRLAGDTGVTLHGRTTPCLRPYPTISRAPADCGHLPFLIRRDGRWFYRGRPITRKELVCLFSSVLTRDAEGAFWLETPTERGRIEVEDAPFLAVELNWDGHG